MAICAAPPLREIDLMISNKLPHTWADLEASRDNDVILAIASVWHALLSQDVNHAFGDVNLFSITSVSRMEGIEAVRGPSPLIMPIILGDNLEELGAGGDLGEDEASDTLSEMLQETENGIHEQKYQASMKGKATSPVGEHHAMASNKTQNPPQNQWEGGIGHLILVIAELTTPTGDIQLKIYDSLPTWIPNQKPTIRTLATNIIHNSDWLGTTPPTVTTEEWVKVTQQSCGNTCGEHTVLNAWAYMLNIPLKKRNPLYNPAPYRGMRLMIQYALEGRLDAETVRAFFQHYRLTAPANLAKVRTYEEEGEGMYGALRGMRSVAMNEDVLIQIVQEIRQEEMRKAKCGPDGQLAQELLDATHTPPHTPEPNDSNQDSPSQPPQEPLLSWPSILSHSLRIHNQHYQLLPSHKRPPSPLTSPQSLTHEQIILAIAPVWAALRDQGVLYAYGGMDIITADSGSDEGSETETEKKGLGVVGGRNPFIMPLAIPTEEEEGPPHHILAIAHHHPTPTHPQTVQLTILDPSPTSTPLSPSLIRHHARHLLTTSSYLGTDFWSEPFIPTFLPEIHTPVPQAPAPEFEGLYVVLNAWAYILGIPLHPGPGLRSGSEPTTPFLT